MQFIEGVLIAIGWIMLLPIMRLLTTFFHEMGHAIPALLFTDDKVDVYIGSYANKEKSKSIQISRLSLFLRFKFFDWQIGMCVPHGKSTILHQIIITIGGPIASILLCSSVLYYLNLSQYPDYILMIALAMFLLAALYLVINLVPAVTSYRSPDGTILMSDGIQLQELFSKRKMPAEYLDLESEYYNRNYDIVISTIEDKINSEPQHLKLYKLLIQSYLKKTKHQKVIDTYEKMVNHYHITYEDYLTIGLSYLELKNYTESIRCLNEYLYQNFNNAPANCARGIARMHLEQNIEAIRDFNATIAHSSSKDLSIPLAHRAYVKIKLNDLEDGYLDLELSSKYDVDQSNDFIYYYKAIYFEKTGNYTEALKYYETSKKKDIDYHGLEYKIYQMEELIKNKAL